jgi:hypothetical protein
MKKSLIIFSIALILISTGCKKWVDGYRISPNRPTKVTPSLLLSVSELAVFATYNGQLARTASIFTQQSAGTDFQMQDVANYSIDESANLNEWRTIYADGLINMQTLIELAGDENPRYRGMGRVLKAMTIGICTDYWGDVPYSDALKGLQGSEGYNPKYDKQEDIIASIQSELDLAITELASSDDENNLLPSSDDFIHGGDAEAWTKMAYILKMRYANRLSKKNPTASAQQSLTIFDNANLSSGDDSYAVYGVNGNELNLWAAFNQIRANYIKMGETLVELLKNTNDPRLPLYCSLDENGGYSGTPKNSFDITTSNLGPLYGGDASPLPLVLYSEALFIKAEAHLRLGQNAEAAAAFNDAVKESIKRTTGASDPTYESTYANEDAASITLEKIMTQKYIDLFTQPEVWADWRRTELPLLTPNPNAQLGGIPRRLRTPVDERIYNSNAVVVSDMLQKVWWDQ